MNNNHELLSTFLDMKSDILNTINTEDLDNDVVKRYKDAIQNIDYIMKYLWNR